MKMVSGWTPPEHALRHADRSDQPEPDEDAAYDKHRQEQVDNDIKLCKDCKYLNAAGSCQEPRNLRADLVNGGHASRNSASYLRDTDGKCGPDAAWFAPKETV